MPTSQDKKHYLSELINLYKEQLNKPIAKIFGELIQEEKKECIQELNLIKQVDMEAALLAKKANTKALSFQ